MICLNNTDVIEGGAATDAVVEYTMHGLVGTTFTQLAAGVLDTTLTTVLYTAPSAMSVVSIILVNKHTSAVAVTLRLDPADGGNPRYIIPKTVSLGAGCSLHTDGARCTVMDASGHVITSMAGMRVIQIVNYQTGAVATGATIMPGDNSIPQITEGDEYMTLAITPKSTSNSLKIDVAAFLSSSAEVDMQCALFRDAVADAQAGMQVYAHIATGNVLVNFSHYMTAPSTSEITFRVRAGGGGVGTTTFNGSGGLGRFDGVLASSITITEIAA